MLFGTLPAIAGEIAKAKAAKQQATTESERVAADERIKTLEAQRDVLIQGTRSPWDTAARAFLMAPFGIYVWKLIVWDKVLDWGSTDPLSDNLTTLLMAVFGFYFVTKLLRR